jgi:hypothetical protein
MNPQSLTHFEPKSQGQSGQTDRTRKKSLRCLPLLFALAALVWGAHTVDAAGYQAVQTLGQGGVFPVNGLAGDAYGQVVAFNRDSLFVSSPGSQPNNKSIAGAVFVYRWDGTQYQPSQVIATGGTGDHLAMLQILAEGDWLVLGAIGTPLGPQLNDTVADQDFRGAVLIYRRSNSGLWELSQTLDSSTPGLQDLTTIGGGGIPVLLKPQGANLGLRMALDAERGWLFVSALYQDGVDSQNQAIMNAGKVYAFRLERSTGTWTLAQSFTNPDGFAVNDAFGAGVAVKGRYAMIGTGSVAQGPHVGPGAVYVYRREGGSWNYVQRLVGSQPAVTPLFFPQFHTNEIPVGDAFGNALALSMDDVVITAPLESRVVSGGVFNGAAYFFQRELFQGEERWVLKQRVESDDPNSINFGAFNVALDGGTAVIGDMTRTGSVAPFQGAAHVYRRTDSWEKSATLSDPQGTPSAGFGAGVAIGSDGRLAVGSSPFLGFFLPVIFRPPPAAAPPVAAGKVIVYDLDEN